MSSPVLVVIHSRIHIMQRFPNITKRSHETSSMCILNSLNFNFNVWNFNFNVWVLGMIIKECEQL